MFKCDKYPLIFRTTIAIPSGDLVIQLVLWGGRHRVSFPAGLK